MGVPTDHSPLRRLPNQNSLHTRTWMWPSIMLGYNLDIEHIPGKVNLANHLSRQSLNQDIEDKNVVRAENNESVLRMMIPENASDTQMQQILSDVITNNHFCPISDSRPKVASSVQDQSIQFSIQD